jgi:putative ABC transport system permease protein
MRGVNFIETTIQDVRFGVRTLAKSPGFTAVLVLVLGMGIGGTTAMFTLIDGVLLRPLPFYHPEQLVRIHDVSPSEIDDVAWFRQAGVFSDVATYRTGGVNVASGEGTERLNAAVVSAGFFGFLGARPQLGRPFEVNEERAGKNQLAILSHRLWLHSFSGDRSALGRSIGLDGLPYVIVGVMPADFSFPPHTDIWVPRVVNGKGLDLGTGTQKNSDSGQHMMGRLRKGAALAQADAALRVLFQRLTDIQARKRISTGIYAPPIPLHEAFVRHSRPALLALFAAVCLVLLIVSANAAGMLLARAVVRQKEVAVRRSLGASRLRVLRHLLTESLILALASGLLGTLFAFWGVKGIRAVAPADIPRLDQIGVDARVLGFALAVSVLAGILVGIAPAFQALKPNLVQTLKEEGFRSTGGLGQRVRSLLVIGEVAVALMLVSSAGLLIRSLYRLTGSDLGFDPRNVLTMDLSIPRERFERGAPPTALPTEKGAAKKPEGAARKQGEEGIENAEKPQGTPSAEALLYAQLLEGIRGLPGVIAAGASGQVPLKASPGYWYFDVGGKPTGMAQIFHVSGDYFGAMGIPLLAGRPFTAVEVQGESKQVIIISRSLARGVWGDKNPLGEQLKVEAWKEDLPREIVGVAGDVTIPGEFEPGGEEHWQFYFPGGSTTTLVVRTASDPNALINPLRKQFLAFDKNLAAFNIETMDEVHAEFAAPPRFRSLLLGLFAALAFFLAVLGLYGVVSYSVACQTHEFGVRMSLGADPGDILRLVLRRGARLAMWGVAMGLAAALGWNRVISSFLFGVAPTDLATFAASALLLIAGALLACSIPAWRASRVQPLVALRYE